MGGELGGMGWEGAQGGPGAGEEACAQSGGAGGERWKRSGGRLGQYDPGWADRGWPTPVGPAGADLGLQAVLLDGFVGVLRPRLSHRHERIVCYAARRGVRGAARRNCGAGS